MAECSQLALSAQPPLRGWNLDLQSTPPPERCVPARTRSSAPKHFQPLKVGSPPWKHVMTERSQQALLRFLFMEY